MAVTVKRYGQRVFKMCLGVDGVVTQQQHDNVDLWSFMVLQHRSCYTHYEGARGRVKKCEDI